MRTFDLLDLMKLDCTLELMKPSSGKSRGSITVRLERRSGTTLSHELINEHLLRLESDNSLNNHSPLAEDDDDLMEALCSLLGLIKPFIQVIGTTSTVWSYRSSQTWMWFIPLNRSTLYSRTRGSLCLRCARSTHLTHRCYILANVPHTMLPS